LEELDSISLMYNELEHSDDVNVEHPDQTIVRRLPNLPLAKSMRSSKELPEVPEYEDKVLAFTNLSNPQQQS